MSLFPLLFNAVLEFVARAIGQEKGMKGHSRKGRNQVSRLQTICFTTQKSLKTPPGNVDLINTFSRVTGYKTNTQN
jgi:hypothetical protein